MERKIDIIRKPIANELEQFKQLYRKEFISLEPMIDDVTKHLLSAQGKLLRPIMIFLSAKLNGEISKATYVSAITIEELHTATLVHDDIVDDANERRGIASIQAKWSPKIAVLAGDYLLAKSLSTLNRGKDYELLEPLTRAMQIISEGELFQIAKSTELNTSEEDYFKIIYKKTASLICAATQMGAISVKANPINVDAMTKIGENIGIAFQIRDDIFDYEKNNESGKPYGNDLKENKLTLPIIYALRQVSENERKTVLNEIRECNKNPQNIDKIIDFVKHNGGISYAEEKMREYSQKSIQLLLSFPDNEARASLIMLAELVASRKK